MTHKIYTNLMGTKWFNFNSGCYDNYSLFDLSMGDCDKEMEIDIQDIDYNHGQSFEQESNDDFFNFSTGDGQKYYRSFLIAESNA